MTSSYPSCLLPDSESVAHATRPRDAEHTEEVALT